MPQIAIIRSACKMHRMGKLTTHILDTAAGKPAAGVCITLHRTNGDNGDGREQLGAFITNDDGRIDGALLEGAKLIIGEYELDFAIGDYFGDTCFYNVITVRFRIKDAGAHYHIPLLVSPNAYTTYRGS